MPPGRTFREVVHTNAGGNVKLVRVVRQPTTLIAVYCQENKITRAWIAGKLGVTRIAVSQWLNRVEKCPRRRQVQIGLILGVEVGGWFDDDGYATERRGNP